MKIILSSFLLFFVSTSSIAQKTLDKLLNQYNTRSIPYISVEELKMKMTSGLVTVLDAREYEEFAVSHIPSAIFVGYNTFSSEEIKTSITNKNQPIVVYCSLGVRSEVIGEKLKKAGYTDVRNLYGGIFEWKNKDYVVLNLEGNESDDVHVCSKLWSKWLTNGNKVYN
ncbi:MAG: rhodanese-like domain-containing protein [Flavobacteriaceae bacterium]|nr:rhodanese-like domain-containing protein [Flavobacteriaceae bacterium]